MNAEQARKQLEQYTKDLIDTCPHCRARVHIEQLAFHSHYHKNKDLEFYVLFRCKPCKMLLLKTLLFKQNRYRDEEDLSVDGWHDKFPMSLDAEIAPSDTAHVPPEVYSDYKEALKCKSIAAYRASCAMFRRSLQNALVTLGADTKLDLIKQIETLDGLPKDIKDWAHQIRIFGNWGAHPDKDQLKNVEEADAAEAHDFISKLLIYVFIMPEKVKLSRMKRDERVNKGDVKKE